MLCERFILASQKEVIKLHIEFNKVHQTEDGNYFLPENTFGLKFSKGAVRFVPVSFPESQLFMDEHKDKIYLINDKNGLEQYGCAAYFVDEGLFKKVISDFEKNSHSCQKPDC